MPPYVITVSMLATTVHQTMRPGALSRVPVQIPSHPCSSVTKLVAGAYLAAGVLSVGLLPPLLLLPLLSSLLQAALLHSSRAGPLLLLLLSHLECSHCCCAE